MTPREREQVECDHCWAQDGGDDCLKCGATNPTVSTAAALHAARIEGAIWALEAMGQHFPMHTPVRKRATRIVTEKEKIVAEKEKE